MSPALNHLRFYAHAATTSLAGLVCSCALLLFAGVVVGFQEPRVPPLLSWLVAVGGLGSVALVTAGGVVSRLGARGAVPALPLSDRLRCSLEAMAWLPVWCLLALVMAATLAYSEMDPSLVVTAVLLSVPVLFLGAFLPQSRSAMVIPLAVLSVIEATCLQLGLAQSPLPAAVLAVVLTTIVIAVGPWVRGLPALRWPSRQGARSRPACPPTQRLVLDALGGMGTGLCRLWPCAGLVLGLFALLILWGLPPGDPSASWQAVVWSAATGLFAVVGGLVFLPFGESGAVVGPEGVRSEMTGEYGRAWSVLPVSRRSVVLAVFLPAVFAALFAVTATVLCGHFAPPYWVDAIPTPAFSAGLYAYAVLVPSLMTACQLGSSRLRCLAAGICLFVLGLTFVASVTREPVLVAVLVAVASVSSVVLLGALLRKP